MSPVTEKTIREIALENPSTIRVFERFGIDYCCGGRKSLEQACTELQLSVDQVIEKLEEAFKAKSGDETDWQKASQSKLIQHIVRKHHTYCRQEIPRLKALSEKVKSRHGVTHPELVEIARLFESLGSELLVHMLKEEQVLFPYIAGVEHARAAGQEEPRPFFGHVTNPVKAMMHDHDDAGEILRKLRKLSSDYTPPMGACPSYQGLFHGLADFEEDMHQHVHLENNILFPRAVSAAPAKGLDDNGCNPGGSCAMDMA
jgi:regulator of cell morphogenesis and NO signaling